MKPKQRGQIMQITKAQLKQMYETMTNKELAKKLGVSETTLTKVLSNAGIALKGRGKSDKKKKLIVVD